MRHRNEGDAGTRKDKFKITIIILTKRSFDQKCKGYMRAIAESYRVQKIFLSVVVKFEISQKTCRKILRGTSPSACYYYKYSPPFRYFPSSYFLSLLLLHLSLGDVVIVAGSNVSSFSSVQAGVNRRNGNRGLDTSPATPKNRDKFQHQQQHKHQQQLQPLHLEA